MSDCPFCKRIAAGDFDSHLSGVVSFEPLNPVTRGHRLVVPVEHVADALASPIMAGRVFEEAARLARGLDCDCNLITSSGPDATQTVLHFHVHIVPRREDDGLLLPWTGQRVSASADAAHGLLRDTLEALCQRDGLSLESDAEPGEPARNYELALRLGIGHAFGLKDQP